MKRAKLSGLLAFWAGVALAHPMGNFSVNHYARIVPREGGADILYVLELGEVPTFELTQKQPAPDFVHHLDITIGGRRVEPTVVSTHSALTDGVGGMKTLRVEIRLAVSGSGQLVYEDRNYPDRAGWKEIVVGDGPDRSHALMAYPHDPAVRRPQQLRASFEMTANGPAAIITESAPEPTPAATGSVPQAPDSTALKQGDYLSQVLHSSDISLGVALICMAVAFGLGALHAFEPGHGKTMVAAYLVGSRGTPKHAALLGLMTTFTHTITVFALGFATMFLSRYIMPEKMSKVLGVISGLSIVWIGGMLLYKRSMKLAAHAHHHHHHHPHDHDHPHHHMPEGDITTGSLIALGASGGLVPCPAALILLLTAISLGRPGFGVLLLLAFSAGLAIVLMATGMVVLYAKNLLPEKHRHSHSPLMQILPVFSAAVIVVIGLVMTAVSLGWVRPVRFFG
jgi:ABC-type nickel/cobalt efflux system permease component RcnA